MTGDDMTQRDYELLSQHLDGELSAVDESALQRRLTTEPELRGTLEAMRLANSRVRDVVHAADLGPVPARVTALLQASPDNNVVPFPARRGRAAVGFAIAASLVAAAGLLLAPQWQAVLHDGDSVDSLLAEALESTASSADQWRTLPDGSQFRPVLSFAATSGQWCREYQISVSGQPSHGVACRGDSGWRTEVLVDGQIQAFSDNQYQPAGAGDLDEISSFINEHATAIPLSATEEAKLIENDWQ